MRSRFASLAMAVLSTAYLSGASLAQGSTPTNLVINGSFELGLQYNGSKLERFPSNDTAFLACEAAGKQQAWTAIDAQGWFAEGKDTSGITIATDDAHSGIRCLRIDAQNTPRSAISSFEPRTEAGPVTLTAWVKTQGAQAALSLDLPTDWHQVWHGSVPLRSSVDLPTDSDWTQITIHAISPAKAIAMCRLGVARGSVRLDDVQIVQSASEAPFDSRPQEWLRLGAIGGSDESLPQFRAGAGSLNLTITNGSLHPISGSVSVWLGPWDHPKQRQIAGFDAAQWPSGTRRVIPLSLRSLGPGAYVATAVLECGGIVIVDGVRDFFPMQVPGPAWHPSPIASRAVFRIAIAPGTLPKDIFGVNNGMLSWANVDPAEYLAASAIGVQCSRGCYHTDDDDDGYAIAMGKMNYHLLSASFIPIDNTKGETDADGVNPAYPSVLDLASPSGLARLAKRAQDVGYWLASRPLIASIEMANEQPMLNSGHLCPSPAADAAFRDWCRQRYGTIERANALWNTHYTSWNDVEQIVSARFLNEVKAQPNLTGTAAIDWTASTGHLSGDVQKRMNANPGLAMDWLRWRNEVTLNAYKLFHDIAKKISPSTLISTNLPWPDFQPQMCMPFDRAMDVTMLDVQYTSGLPRSLGNPYEMMDAIEMAETAAPDKPVWGIETYYQPQFPAEFIALQNWGLLAHGMTNNLVFAWKPYSDAGSVIGTHAWEKPGAPPMWFIIDKDSTKLLGYFAYKRSLDEIRAFHERYNGLRIRRAPTDTAFYVSPDTAHYVNMSTGNMPWNSPWQRTRNNLIFLMRMHGIAVDYVDDETLPGAPGKYRKIVVPASYILAQPAAERLASFARRGGTVILAGMSGLRDPWLRPYSTIGGAAWADLGWSAPNYADDFAPVLLDPGVSPSESKLRGVHIGSIPGAKPIVDAAGSTIGWERAWGAGKLVAFGVFPDAYIVDPHATPDLHAYVVDLIKHGGLAASACFTPQGAWTAGDVGEGSAVVEAVVRQKSDREKFLFCLNQGGDGRGTASAALGQGNWTATDVLTGAPIKSARIENGTWSAPLSLKAFGYAVIRLTKS